MSAPQIPNLLTLRGRGGGRGRERGRGGRGGHGGQGGAQVSQADRDRLIQETDSDAAASRLSAVLLGYLKDEFSPEFGAHKDGNKAVRRLPIINRGTYVRTECIDRLILNLMHQKPEQQVQIISLGAGTDTRPFKLGHMEPETVGRILYHELDFPAVSKKKYEHASNCEFMDEVKCPGTKDMSMLDALRKGGTVNPEADVWGWTTKSGCGYMFHPVDLREVAKTGEFPEASKNHFRNDMITVLISECCLCYMTAPEADAVINYFTNRIDTIGIILYEPMKPYDAFGTMMTENLASRGLSMPSIKTYHDLQTQVVRLRNCGFDMFQEGASIEWLWLNWFDEDEHLRQMKLQQVDEEEEWNLLAGHYLICWAVKEGENCDDAFAGWDHMEGEVERMLKEKGPIVETNESR